MYRILIVEDTLSEAEALLGHLERYGAEHDVAFSTEVLSSAFEFLDFHRTADLIFMDIGLPGVSGMEAAEALRSYDIDTPLIFVTSLAQYAVRGYAVDALDFVIKPVEYHDFAMRMDRAMRVMQRQAKSTIAIRSEGIVHVVNQADIVYVDMLKHDVRYHLANGQGELKERGSLRDAAQELDAALFLRISSGCLVNMGQVSRIASSSVVMTDGSELYYSRSQRKHALEMLANYVGRSI